VNGWDTAGWSQGRGTQSGHGKPRKLIAIERDLIFQARASALRGLVRGLPQSVAEQS